ncbi:MAG TPA: hypothetical protein VM553_00090 [Dongiaceae bacterium]|nr:hypothetical protein [Dongiaceae bacterium]
MSDAVAIVLKYLWFIVIPIGLVGVTVFKMRKANVLSEKGVSSSEANAAYRVIAAAVVVTAAGIGLVQLVGGIDSPFFLYSGNLNNVYVIAGKSVLALFWLGFLMWVWGSRQFVTYAKLVLPRKANSLLPLAKPVASLVAIIGLSFLMFYQANRVSLAILNLSPQSIEWIAVIHQDSRHRIDAIPQQQQTVHSVPLNDSGTFKIQYKMKEKDNIWQATIPFPISEFSMGFVKLVFDRDGKLHIADHLLLR